MIRAAILPYARVPGGACCVVVVHDGPAVLVREDIPVGHLATVSGRITRIVGPPEVAAVVARVVEIMRARGVEEARIEDPAGAGTEADRGRDLVTSLLHGLPVGVVRVVSPAVRGDIAARLRALMEDEGLGVGGETSSPAPAKPSTASPEPTPAPPPAQALKACRRVLAVDPGSKHVAAVVLEEARRGGIDPQSSPSPKAPGPAGSTTRGAESTTTHLARYVASLPLTLGREVPLRRPKVITRKDGVVITKTTRREVTEADIEEALRALARFAAEHDVDEAAVEVATFAHKGAGAFLLRSNEIGGEVCGWLRAAGLPVRRVSSRVWRARVRAMYDGDERSGDDVSVQQQQFRGGARGAGADVPEGEPRDRLFVRHAQRHESVNQGGQAKEGQDRALTWRLAVRALVANLPPDADVHILDASGAALWALAPEPAPEVAPPAKPRAQGGAKASVWTPEKAEQRRRAREAAKRARGCIGCVGQHHRAPCPIEVARLAKVAPSMRGNQNAKKGP